MSKSLARKAKHELEDTVEDVAEALRQAADGLSDDAETAVARAAQALRRASDALAAKASPEARYVAAKVAQQVKAHPVVTAAAALSAAAALIALLSRGRKRPA